ncbi:MAG: hypothetical protein GYA59_03065 [Chloroflexi bacterium]|nr:hypothetical protein [Chloroflexota bacterium]
MDESFLEKTWGEILSRRPARIRRMFATLDDASQREVLQHLRRMVNEPGWQEPQVISARAALNALDLPQAAANE